MRASGGSRAAGLLLLTAVLCLLSAAAPAGAAQPAARGVSLGTPSARSPQGTTTPLRPTFSWSKVRGASSYDIQILQGGKLRRFFNGHHGESRHVLNALPANVRLTWRVRARAGGRTGAWSRGVRFIISPPPIVSPVGTITADTPTFEWTKLRGATDYDCSISGTGSRLVKSGLTARTCTFGRALPINVPLTWRVRGRNADGKGVWSKAVPFIVVPDAPSLTITANDRGKTYGHALALGDGAFSAAGLQAGDAVTSVTLSSAGAAAAAAVSGSPYSIVPSAATGVGLDKYAITYVDGHLAVERRPLTVSGAVAQDRVYDGGATATVVFKGAGLTGVVGGDVVRIDSSGYSARFASASAGNGRAVAVTGVTLSGADAGNYTVSQPTGLAADITAKHLKVTGAVAADKIYDGTTTATVDFSGAGLDGVVVGDVVVIDSSGYSAHFASASVGSGKAVTVTGVSLAGADAGDYTVSQPSGLTADIAPATTVIGSSTAPLMGSGSTAYCFYPNGTQQDDLVFAIVQAQERYRAIPDVTPEESGWVKVGDHSYSGSIAGASYHFYQALFYHRMGATWPLSNRWDFPTRVDDFSVTDVTLRHASYDTGSNVAYTVADASLRAGAVTPAGTGEAPALRRWRIRPFGHRHGLGEHRAGGVHD